MCGISAVVVQDNGGVSTNTYRELLTVSDIRGQDGTGIAMCNSGDVEIVRWRERARDITFFPVFNKSDICIGQNRLAVFGLTPENDQPIETQNYVIVHNGNLYNHEALTEEYKLERKLTVDTEVIIQLIEKFAIEYINDLFLITHAFQVEDNTELYTTATMKAIEKIFSVVKGNYACILYDNRCNKLFAFRKYKPLYKYTDDYDNIYLFSTERIGEKTFGVKNFIEVPENQPVIIKKENQ